MDLTTDIDWSARADDAQATLRRRYLRPLGLPGLGVLRSPPRLRDRFSASYWWQAQLLEVLLDARARDPGVASQRQIDRLIAGQRLANGGNLRREYYDDMGWMAIALVRAGRLEQAEGLWRTIRDGWNDQHGGGVPWRVDQRHYKNTPSNGPAAILAARLGHDDWAHRIIDWMETVLIDTSTGEVLDGIDRLGDGEIDRDWHFSYNYGTALTAELELGRVDVASRIASAGIARCAPDGPLRSEGDGDGALFKGVFARSLAQLGTPEARRAVLATAAAFWGHRDQRGRFGPDPSSAPEGPVELGAMVAGVTVLEAAARCAVTR